MKRTCKSCNELKDLEKFAKAKGEYRQHICSMCLSVVNRNNYEKNKEELKEKNRIYYQNNRDLINKSRKEKRME